MPMIKSIQVLPGPAKGHRVAFRLNAQAVQPQCFSRRYDTLEELYTEHPDLAPPEEMPAKTGKDKKAKEPGKTTKSPAPATTSAPAPATEPEVT